MDFYFMQDNIKQIFKVADKHKYDKLEALALYNSLVYHYSTTTKKDSYNAFMTARQETIDTIIKTISKWQYLI